MKAKAPSEAAPARAGTSSEDPLLSGPETGLFIRGSIMGRRRRAFVSKANGTTRYVITLAVLTTGGLYKVDRWSDVQTPTDTPAIGQLVALPVNLVYYQGRNGTQAKLTWGTAEAADSF